MALPELGSAALPRRRPALQSPFPRGNRAVSRNSFRCGNVSGGNRAVSPPPPPVSSRGRRFGYGERPRIGHPRVPWAREASSGPPART
jgi:hypothetical protein